MLLLLFGLRNESMGTSLSRRSLFWTIFASVLLKCLFNGFDFILPTLGMIASPFVFYGVKDKWSQHRSIERSMDVVLAVLAAVLTTLLILSIQITLETGSFEQAVHAITHAFSRRTLGSDQNLLSAYAEVQKASTWSILKIYLSESYFYSFQVPYYSVIILVALVSAIQTARGKIRTSAVDDVQIKGDALLVTTWFSILGPLSWYIIFKSVAYFHTHMNYLPWHMPFTLFGFGLCGFFIQSMIGIFTSSNRARG
jgi:NADH:ubiquinone oxidoreductase subunit 6 (subunit J)